MHFNVVSFDKETVDVASRRNRIVTELNYAKLQLNHSPARISLLIVAKGKRNKSARL